METVAVAKDISKLVEEIRTQGFFLSKQRVEEPILERLVDAFEDANHSPYARSREGNTYALRNILKAVPGVYETAICHTLLEPVRSVLGGGARPVKAILFDKTETANWNLRWHQDNVISVEKRLEVPGFTGWSMKVGIPHVRPPVAVLESMLAARTHIDDCPQENGALKVIPGSHCQGRLSPEQFQKWINEGKQTVCAADRGQVLFMRPLVVHSSARAVKPCHRRVLHIEYAADDLPGGLVWGV